MCAGVPAAPAAPLVPRRARSGTRALLGDTSALSTSADRWRAQQGPQGPQGRERRARAALISTAAPTAQRPAGRPLAVHRERPASSWSQTRHTASHLRASPRGADARGPGPRCGLASTCCDPMHAGAARARRRGTPRVWAAPARRRGSALAGMCACVGRAYMRAPRRAGVRPDLGRGDPCARCLRSPFAVCRQGAGCIQHGARARRRPLRRGGVPPARRAIRGRGAGSPPGLGARRQTVRNSSRSTQML